MTKDKKFIDKKKSVTYKLVPLETGPSQFEADAPKYTFVPISKGGDKKPNPFAPPPLPTNQEEPVTVERIFPFSGPRPDWDPDVVAALDDDFNFDDPDNELDDDFIAQANGTRLKGDDEPSDDDEDVDCEDNDDDSMEYSSEFSEDDEMGEMYKGKTRSTNYSMTSAVTNCTENIKILNERFEKMMDSYDDDQIGALDFEEIEGNILPDSSRVEEMMIEEMSKTDVVPIDECDEEVKKQVRNYTEYEKPEIFEVISSEKAEVEFDCESILSTYSNIYNHPTIIKSEHKKVNRRLTRSLLKKLEREAKAEEEEEDSDDDDDYSVATTSFTRPKDETPEQRKERKKVVQEIRKENRIIKKENKLAFRKEKLLQDAQIVNSRHCRGLRIQ